MHAAIQEATPDASFTVVEDMDGIVGNQNRILKHYSGSGEWQRLWILAKGYYLFRWCGLEVFFWNCDADKIFVDKRLWCWEMLGLFSPHFGYLFRFSMEIITVFSDFLCFFSLIDIQVICNRYIFLLVN